MRLSRSAALTAAALVGTLASVGLGTTPALAGPPGPVGSPIVLGSGLTKIAGYDIATDPSSGTAYVGWISDGGGDVTPTVHLCVLPPAATSCAGGVLAANALDPSTAAGLHVVETAPGTATLVWFHGSGASELGYATYAGGVLSSSSNASVPAPSNGSLDDVVVGPDGQIWAVTEDAASSVSNVITVRDGLNSAPTSFTAPFPVSAAQLAFSGSQPIVAVSNGSQIGEPVRVTSGPAWSALAPVAGTWQKGTAFDVVGAGGGRLVASTSDASYHPVSAAWNGSSFTGATLTGDDNNCSPYSHDLVTDPSGRVADVTIECDDVAVANMADTRHSGLVRFATGGTSAGGDPQIGSFANGTAWVAWGIEAAGNTMLLRVTRVALPGQQVTVTTKKKFGTASLTGPASCLPPVAVAQSVASKAAKHWKAGKTTLTLDGHKISTPGAVDGSTLAAGSTHALVSKTVFKHKAPKKHGHHRVLARGHHGHAHHHHKKHTKTVTVSLSFRVC